MSYLDTALQRLEQLIDRKLAKAQPFRAIVTGTSGNTVTVRRLDATTGETEPRAKLSGVTVVNGDEVLCLPINGKPIVVGKIVR